MVVNFGQVTLGKDPVIIGIVNQFLDLADLSSLPGLVKVLEIRADSLLAENSLEELTQYCQKIKNLNKFALLLTVRENWQLDIIYKQKIINTLLNICDGIDLEIDLADKKLRNQLFDQAKKAQKTIVASYHNFVETPDLQTLSAIVRETEELGADIIKLAVMANCTQDVQQLYDFLSQHKNLIAISMGEIGKMSRIEAFKYGSLATYAPISVSNAPGQLSLEQIVLALSS